MNQESTLARIRAVCRDVAERARHVRIHEEAIPAFVAPLIGQSLPVPELDTASHFVGTAEETVIFFTTLAAINFGSGYFPRLIKRSGLSGYYTIASALTDRFRATGPLSAEELAALSADDCAELFGQGGAHRDIRDLMGLFARALNDLGTDVTERFGGSFPGLIEAADKRAEHLVDSLAHQPFFRDVSSYHGIEVPFFKRSQLLGSDLSLALAGQGWGEFGDLDQLTIFADNLVPHVLRLEGVLVYSDELIAMIEAEQLLPAGSDCEIEIRACCVHAVELIIEAAARSGTAWTARDVDQVLWHRGQAQKKTHTAKRHRTQTVFY